MAKRVHEQNPAKGAGRMPPAARPKPVRIPGAPDRFVITASMRDWIRKKVILPWDKPTISWDAILDVVRKKYPKGKLQRQSLAKYEPLQKAFQATKRRLTEAREEAEMAKLAKLGKGSKPKSGSEEYLDRRNQELQQKVDRLERENAELKQQFARWQLNAFAAGMTMQELDRRRGRVDRGQVDE